MTMKYDLFLFDLDDTLFDFSASETNSFRKTMVDFDIPYSDDLFETYKVESAKVWELLEQGKISKEKLRVERFKKTFNHFAIDVDCDQVSDHYLDQLPENIILVDGAVDVCNHLLEFGRIGIITNGIQNVQEKRLANSPLRDKVSFMIVSEECGYAKPDERFFEHAMKVAGRNSKENILVIGDRLETDILGAHRFGLDSCWFNPHKTPTTQRLMTHEVASLRQIPDCLQSKFSHRKIKI